VSIDVVVVTWRGRDVLRSCLEHLGRSTVDHRVVVVDNASDDGSVEMVRGVFPDVDLVVLPSNVGFGRAVNVGVRRGAGEVIVLVNNDVDVEPTFLERITAPLADDTVGMVAGMTLMPGTGKVDAFGVELDPAFGAYNRLRHGDPTDAPGLLAVPSGGAAAYRRSAFLAVGGFDERLFAYGEDVDLGLRLRLRGWVCVGVPDARGVHLGGATAGVDSPFQRSLFGVARGFLLRRYGLLRRSGWWRVLLLEAVVVGWGLVRHRTTVPLVARVRGWRLAATSRSHLPLPDGVINTEIGMVETLRRLVTAR
jgi:GT2 family glycosyltransferase